MSKNIKHYARNASANKSKTRNPGNLKTSTIDTHLGSMITQTTIQNDGALRHSFIHNTSIGGLSASKVAKPANKALDSNVRKQLTEIYKRNGYLIKNNQVIPSRNAEGKLSKYDRMVKSTGHVQKTPVRESDFDDEKLNWTEDVNEQAAMNTPLSAFTNKKLPVDRVKTVSPLKPHLGTNSATTQKDGSHVRSFMDMSSSRSKTNINSERQYIMENEGFDPSQEASIDEKVGDIVSSLNNYYAKNGFYNSKLGMKEVNVNKKTATQNDAYYKNLEEFVDKTLKTIAQKITEKKELELDNTKLRIGIKSVDAENEQIGNMCLKIAAELRTGVEKCNNIEMQNNDMKILLEELRAKIDLKQQEFTEETERMNIYKQELMDMLEDRKKDLKDLKDSISSDRMSISSNIKDMEEYYFKQDRLATELRRKASYSKNLEKSRVKMLQDKSKVLNNLIRQESLTEFHSPVSRDIYKILQTPKKPQRAMSANKSSCKLAKKSIMKNRL